MKKNKLQSSYVKKGTQPMKSPNLVSLSSSDNINNITFGDLDILDANSTKLVAGQSSSGISYEDIEGHLFESFISKNINVGDNYSEGVSITNSEIRLATDLDNYYDGTRINNNSIRIGSGFDQAEIGVGGITVGTGNSCALVGTGWMNLGTNIVLGTGVIQAENIYATDVQATNSHFNGTVNTNLIIASRGIQVGSDISLGTGIIEASGIKCDGGLISARAVNAGVAQIDTAAFNLSISTTVQTDYITVKDEGTGKLSVKNANNIALEILRTSANSRVYMPLLGYTSNLNYTSLHACGGIFVGDQDFSAVENKYYPELSLHTHSGAWIHNIFSRSNMYRLSYAHKNNSDLSCTITIDTDGTIGGDAKIANQQSVTYQQLYNMRSNQKLIPGRFYRITDYVTTTMQKDTRSAGHQFDVIVRADSNSTLSETAWAAKHSGDTYFQNAKLEAWELKYNLDNMQWSQQAGTYVTDKDNEYTFRVIGDIALSGRAYKLLQGLGMYVQDWSDYALMETVAEGEQIICYYGDPEDFDPEEPEVVGIASGVNVFAEGGKGTITWMRDEFGNECPYDFKNVQFKRYMATDSVSGREGLDGKYMVADVYAGPQGLSVQDIEDFIWAYTFSSDSAGGEQTDYSLADEHLVFGNVFRPYVDGLPNNVMFGANNYNNSFGLNCSYNSLGSNCYCNSFGDECYYNSCGDSNRNNSYSNVCNMNSCGSDHYGNSWGYNCCWNSLGNDCNCNSWGCYCNNNSWGNYVTQSTLFGNVSYTQITTQNVKNVQVMNGVAGTSSSKLTLTFAANKTYTQVAAMTTAGQLKIWNPADLVQ